MALIGINQVAPRPRKPSTMEQIALGVDIATKLLGTGLQGYKTFAMDKPLNESEIKLKEAQAKNLNDPNNLDNKLKNAQINYYSQAKPMELEKSRIELEKAKKPQIPDHMKKTAEDMAQQVVKYQAAQRYLENELEQFSDTSKPEDIRVKIGEGMLKGLNSVLGPDAVGKDEREALGGLLKYKKGNLFEPGSFVGRDLDLFAEQIKSKIQSIAGSEKAALEQVNRIYNQYGLDAAEAFKAQKQGLKVGDIVDGHKYMGGNPNDPKSWQVVR